jgi:hypothetical protein
MALVKGHKPPSKYERARLLLDEGVARRQL